MGRIVFAGGQVLTVDFDAVGIAERIKQHSNPGYVCNVQGSGQNAGASTSLDGGGWMPISVDGRDEFVQISSIAHFGN
jgi:hypothetical protein